MSGFMICHFFTEAIFMITIFLTEKLLDSFNFYIDRKTIR